LATKSGAGLAFLTPAVWSVIFQVLHFYLSRINWENSTCLASKKIHGA